MVADERPTAAPNAEDVWRALHGALRAFIARRVHDPADVDDVLQDTFLAVHRNIDALREEQRLASWVYQVARSRIADHYRRRRPSEPVEDGPADDTTHDEDDAVRAQVASWLPGFLDQLPETYREAVRLAELEGLTQREVAARLGLSLSGAKSRVQRGRAQLLALVEACCAMETDARGRVIGFQPRSDGCGGCRGAP